MREWFSYTDVIILMIISSFFLPIYACLMIESNIKNQKLAFIFGLIESVIINFILFHVLTHSPWCIR